MITYRLEMVENAIKEVCKKFEMTKSMTIKKIKYISKKKCYLVMLDDDSKHIIMKEFINKYIESFGTEGEREIARGLVHSIELEESAFQPGAPDLGDYWDGNIHDVIDYLDEQGKTESIDDVEKEEKF